MERWTESHGRDRETVTRIETGAKTGIWVRTETGTGTRKETRTERRMEGRWRPGTFELVVEVGRKLERGGIPRGNQLLQPQDGRPSDNRELEGDLGPREGKQDMGPRRVGEGKKTGKHELWARYGTRGRLGAQESKPWAVEL